MIIERQTKIMEILSSRHFATVKELAASVYCSESSVRRDIKALVAKGYLYETYGGVVLPEYSGDVVPVGIRDGYKSAIKDELARRAAAYVEDGATVIMDGSSTVRRIVKYIGDRRNVRIITNNVKLLTECKSSGMTVYLTGGRYLPESNILVGRAAEDQLREINADVCFFSSQAVSEEGEISDASEEETSLRRVMLSRAAKKIFVFDSSKLGLRRTFKLCSVDEVDEVITDGQTLST